MVKIHWNRVRSSGIQSPASFPLKKNEKKNVALGIEKQLVKNQIKHYTLHRMYWKYMWNYLLLPLHGAKSYCHI
jgi:hypothetical protein